MYQREEAAAPRRGSRRLAGDLVILAFIGVMLIGATAATFSILNREFYSASAFVQHYVSLLSQGRAADALRIPGVGVDSAQLEAAGLPPYASEALLRRAAMAPLDDLVIVDEREHGDATDVTVSYSANGHDAKTTFTVSNTGGFGPLASWRFDVSPLSVIDLSVDGSMTFSINGFDVDKRQVSVDGSMADPTAAVPLLVFAPGAYSVSVSTPTAEATGTAVIADAPMAAVPVAVTSQPTKKFSETIQTEVDSFLNNCATAQVLQPTGCPFGLTVENRIASGSVPTWSITQQPVISLQPDGANWVIPTTEAVAHIDVQIQSVYDGSVADNSQDVPFLVSGVVTMLPDGRASIMISGPDTE